MFCRIKSYSMFGIKAVPVSVEVDASQGLPGFTLVGLPDNAVRESRERVVSAIRSVGKVVTGFRTTVNLSPADMRKDAPPLDLAIAVGLLAACVEIYAKDIEKYVFLGELTLDGKVRPVRGVLPVARKICKDEIFVIPSANVAEANIVEGLRYVCVDTLRDCIELLEGKTTAQAVRTGNGIDRNFSSNDFPDFKDIPGIDGAKRALEVAAAGGQRVGQSKTDGLVPGKFRMGVPQETDIIRIVSAVFNPRDGVINLLPPGFPFRKLDAQQFIHADAEEAGQVGQVLDGRETGF